MRLLFCDTLDGNDSSLKNIDPLDYYGDGSNVPLEVGDRAVVADATGKTAFYILKSAAGQSDSGILILVPNNNPGDFYWSCCGFTKDTIDVPSGTQFNILSGSEIPPGGFTGAVIPYSELPFMSWDVYYDGTEAGYYGCALLGNILHVVTEGDYHRWDLVSNTYTYTAITNTHGFWGCPTHCIESPEGGSENMITDIDDLALLSRFLIDEGVVSHIPFVFVSPATSWADVFGSESTPRMALRIGKWMYVCRYPPDVGFGKVNILTGEVYKLADFPFAPKDGCMCPDFEYNQIYYVSEKPDCHTMRYSIDTDSWEDLATSPADLWWMHMGWIDQKTRQLILPGLDNQTHIYDIVSNTWSSYPYTESPEEGGIPLYYKDFGMVCPFGYFNKDSSLSHFIMRKDNPVRITKT